MRPKEKARELVETFWTQVRDYNLSDPSISKIQAIQSALIAVNEIITELTQEISPSVHGFRHTYWKEVKEIIEEYEYQSYKRRT